MKTSPKILFTLSFFLLMQYGCDDSVTNTIDESNLIVNSSFEKNGNSTLFGWKEGLNANVNFTNDTPPGGGNWAVTIESEGPFPRTFDQLTTKVKISPGTFKYQLSIWAKYYIIHGWADLYLIKPDTTILTTSFQINDTTWENYTSIVTVTSEEGDSLRLNLTGGASELIAGRTYFDLCTLKILE
ncbi:hypothetical protein BMS3Abin03_01114 [bacterium BMS3Abin03]|nr:hypothetical protein BMS3Abin03_01114 [bacterium BMS3Abin03]